MLRRIDHNIWVAEQPLRYFGLGIGARMSVVRLSNKDLAVISPISLSPGLQQQLAELGRVAHIIETNLYHHFFAAECKGQYTQATFWAAPGLAEKKPALPIDNVLPPEVGSGLPGLETIFLEGFKTFGSGGFEELNEYVFFHADSRTLILTDAAFHFDDTFPPLTQFVARVTGLYNNLSPSWLERIATKDKEPVRKSLEKILCWDFERGIMAHGSLVERHGKERFRAGYEKLLGDALLK